MKSPWRWLVDGKIVGANEAWEKATKTGRFDYDAPIAGLEVVDRYTLRIRLVQPDLRFLYALAVPNTAAVAREVVEAYGLDFGAHPVGTGPYQLGEYKRSAKIVLVANPGYRETTYVPAGPVPAESLPAAAALKGKKLPIPGRIEANVIEEGQAQWLAFLNREVELLERLPPAFVDEALADGKLKPALAAKGIRHEMLLRPNTWWTYFNMDDPVVGGYTPERIALRRAISMGYDEKEAIRVLLKGRAAPAQSPIPPGIVGYDPQQKTQAQLYDPAAARALLDRFGYKDRDGDGYRETPEGKPLVLEFWSPPTLIARQGDELWKKNMDAIGIRMAFKKDKTPELRKMARLGKIPMRADGWNADYPDAENYMQLLYGPNAGQENQARFRLPEFDALYDRARTLPDSPERTALFDRMTRAGARVCAMAADGPPIRRPAAPAVGGPLRAAPHPGAGLAIRRRRHESASEIGRSPHARWLRRGNDEASGSITCQPARSDAINSGRTSFTSAFEKFSSTLTSFGSIKKS